MLTSEKLQKIKTEKFDDIFFNSLNFSVGMYCTEKNRKQYTIPDYQRDYVWTTKQASQYIESIILGFPLNPILGLQTRYDRYEIIDGSQRLRTLWHFVNDDFALHGCNILSDLNFMRFNDFDAELKVLFEISTLPFLYIRNNEGKNVNRSIILDLFNRINICTPMKKGDFDKASKILD